MSKERTGPVDREHTANVMKSLHALRSQDIATDVTLHCKDGEFRAHSVVLLTSPIADKVKARNSEIVDLSDLPASGVAVLLDYIYLGRARLSLENGLSALEVSRQLNVRDLFDKCRKFICPFMIDPTKGFGGLDQPEATNSKSEAPVLPPIALSKRNSATSLTSGVSTSSRSKLDLTDIGRNSGTKKSVSSPEPEKKEVNGISRNLSSPPANMQNSTRRIIVRPPEPITTVNDYVKPIPKKSTPPREEIPDDRSEIESIASSYTETTITPSSSDTDSKDNEDSHLSDQSDKTTSSLGRFSFIHSKTTC